MITAPITGNLGNHMFQYALTRTIAEHNGYKWGFNPSPEFDYHNGKPQMDFMEINYGKVHNLTYYEIEDNSTIKKEYSQDKMLENGEVVSFYPYNEKLFSVPEKTKLYISCGQDARYYDRDKLKEWFRIKEEEKGIYKAKLREWGIDIENDNVCIINIRGGEYKGVPNLILRENYWQTAITHMIGKNPKMRFIGISDDVQYANKILNFTVPVTHMSIGGDYYIINHAKNLILSNSSFAIFPAWLNENDPFVIAPRFWARHNVTEKYWINSDVWTFGWNFLGKDGKLYDG